MTTIKRTQIRGKCSESITIIEHTIIILNILRLNICEQSITYISLIILYLSNTRIPSIVTIRIYYLIIMNNNSSIRLSFNVLTPQVILSNGFSCILRMFNIRSSSLDYVQDILSSYENRLNI